MHFSYDKRHAKYLAEQASLQIAALDLPFDPPMFELWFTYYSGGETQVCSRLDSVIAAGNPTYTMLLAIYEELIRTTRCEHTVRLFGRELNSQAQGTIQAISRAAETSRLYHESLNDEALKLKDTEESRGLRATIADLVTLTSDMQRANMELQKQLASSAAYIRDLQECFDAEMREVLLDSVTGVSNRRAFEVSLNSAIAHSDNSGERLSLLLVDVDNFKCVNDTYGHLVGDQVLRLIVSEIRKHCRSDDIIGRYGGDEFAIILPGASADQALTVAETIRKQIMVRKLFKRSTKEVIGQVTISIGVAEHQGGCSGDDLIERADKWLYSAKKMGRNRVCDGEADRLAIKSADQLDEAVRWKGELETGNQVMDDQHRQLMDLATGLLQLNGDEKSKDLYIILNAIIQKLKEHCADEETELQKAGFGHLDRHRQLHAKLLCDAAKVESEFRAGRMTWVDVREFIVNELILQHMLAADEEFRSMWQRPRVREMGRLVFEVEK